jgi:hypothetical protein
VRQRERGLAPLPLDEERPPLREDRHDRRRIDHLRSPPAPVDDERGRLMRVTVADDPRDDALGAPGHGEALAVAEPVAQHWAASSEACHSSLRMSARGAIETQA